MQAGWTALHKAAERGCFEIVEALLLAKADRRIMTVVGNT